MNIAAGQCLKILRHACVNRSHVCGLERGYSFKSPYSLENLYPKSNLKLSTPEFVPEDPNAKFSGYIPIKQLKLTYCASSGPGGQNVNCVNTKVDLRFQVKDAAWLSDEIKQKLAEQNKTKISKEGYLVIKSELTRSQQLNLADALEKLRKMIRKATEPGPPPMSIETQEMLRKREMKAARERLFVKRKKSQVKEDRRGVNSSELF